MVRPGCLGGNRLVTSNYALRRAVTLIFILTLCSASWAQKNYTITPSAGPNGSISPDTPQTVSENGGVTFTATPNAGYVVDQWLVSGTAVTDAAGEKTFTDSLPTKNETVQVTFAKAPAQNSWNERWDYGLNGAGGTQINYYNGYDTSGNAWAVYQVSPPEKPQYLEILELNQYGGVAAGLTIPSTNMITPRGFGLDRTDGGFVLLADTLDSTYQETETLTKWDANWKQTFTENLIVPSGASVSGLGLGMDFSDNIYTARCVQGSSTYVEFAKYNSLGNFVFKRAQSGFSDYVKFNRFGGASALGYQYNQGVATAAIAMVFSPDSPTLSFYRSVPYTKTTKYDFGAATWDKDDDLFLNLAAQTSSGATSLLQCYSPTWNLLYSTEVPGYAWYADGSSPYECFVWGSSDVGNTTGQFLASIELRICGLERVHPGTHYRELLVREPHRNGPRQSNQQRLCADLGPGYR